MKLVREHINEVFTQDSDPIHDLGIGIVMEPGTVVSLKKPLISGYESQITQWGRYKFFEGNDTHSLLPDMYGVIIRKRNYKNRYIKLSIAFFGKSNNISISKTAQHMIKEKISDLMNTYSVGYANAPLETWLEYLNFNVRL